MRRTETFLKIALWTAVFGFVSAGSLFAVKSFRNLSASAVRGVAFFDCNADGLKNVGETGFGNVAVVLAGRSTAGDSVRLTTTTDAAGLYSFPGVAAGVYRVSFAFPLGSSGLQFSPRGDSKANPDGSTDPFSMDGTADATGIDVGIIDHIAPKITFTNPLLATVLSGDTLSFECDNAPILNETYAIARDNSGKTLPISFVDSARRVGSCQRDGFLYLLHCAWNAADDCGNAASIEVFIKIIDSTPPTLNGIPADLTVNMVRGETVPPAATGVTGADNCTSSGLSIAFSEEAATNTCGKIITRTWKTADACGNQGARSQRITVVSNSSCDSNGLTATDTFRLTLLNRNGNPTDTCLNLGAGRRFTDLQHCGVNVPQVSASLRGGSCLELNPSVFFSGLDTFCARTCDASGANCRDMFLIITVNAPRLTPCNIITGAHDATFRLTDCAGTACYCLGGATDIRTLRENYTITDNGQPYGGTFMGCNFDTTFSYSYFAVPSMGDRGPYRLDYWQVNSTLHTIPSFQTIEQLVDSMRVWDAVGNWQLDTTLLTIYGGTPRNTYSQMKLTRLGNGAYAFLDLNTNLASGGVQLCFARGQHNVIFTNTLTTCSDTLRVNVLCGNDTIVNNPRRPVAVDDRATTSKNTAVTLTVLANDTLNGFLTRPVSITRFQNHGSVNVNILNNQIVYTPVADFCGANDTFSYQICNAYGCDTADVVVSVTCGSDTSGGRRRPVAVDDRVSVRQNTAITIPVLANDTLNGTLTGIVRIVRFQQHGTVNVNITNNQIVYTPSTNFCSATDTFSYEICNANGCDTADVFVAVTCNDTTNNGNRKPIAVDDRVSTRLNTPIRIAVLSNDTLNGTLTSAVRIIRFQTHGAVNVLDNSQIIYTPTSGFCGATDTFSYEICNANGCDTADVFVTISCSSDTTGGLGNRKPVAVDDRISTRRNTAVTIPVLNNDSLNGTLIRPLSIIRFQTHGTATVQNSQIVYTPTTGFCGANDTLSYEICNVNGCDTADVVISVTCDTIINNPRRPVAVDDRPMTRLNTAVTIAVLANDSLNGTLTSGVRIVRFQNHGTVNVLPNNQIVYTPVAGFCGANDTFSYQICNATGCDTADVFVTITCGSDTTGNGGNRKPVAIDDRISTRLNTAVTIPVLNNDSLNGTLTRPLSIIRFQTHGTTSVQNNQIVYTPTTGFCGSNDTLSYEICNANGCDTADVIVAVSCQNDTTSNKRKPIAVDDKANTRLNTPVTIPVLNNDTLNGTLVGNVRIVRFQSHGTLNVLPSTNQIIYTPVGGFCGASDTFSYQICNANGCDTADVIVSINCSSDSSGNRSPVAVNDAATTRKNRPVSILVLANDTLNGSLSRPIVVSRTPRNGMTAVSGSQIVYTPNANFCGAFDTLSYVICNINGCDTADVIVMVTCDGDTTANNLKPIAVDDRATTRLNTPVTIPVLNNDTLNGALVGNVRIIRFQSHGTVNVMPVTNQIIYTPVAGFCGTNDTFSYQICNANGCDTADVIVFINCSSDSSGNRPPVAVNDVANTRKNRPVSILVLANDTLNGSLSRPIVVSRTPRNGTTAVSGSQIVYTPNANFCGAFDTLSYVICNINGCDTADVIVTVTCDGDTTANNLPPVAVNDTASTRSNAAVIINVLQNDTLNGTLRVPLSILRSPRFGLAAVVLNNQIVYTPTMGFCGGRDTLSYVICNANGCDTADVVIRVVCDSAVLNRPPVAVPDVVTTRKNTPIRIAILSNDTLNGTLDSIKIIRSPLFGTASLGNDNVLTYTPDSCGFTDNLIYRICNRNGCDTALVTIKVICDTNVVSTRRPVAIDDTARTAKNRNVTIAVVSNDSLFGLRLDTIYVNLPPQRGSAIVQNAQIVYTPQRDSCNYSDTLNYVICNRNGCDTGQLRVFVSCDTTATNDTLPPVAVFDRGQTTRGGSVTINVTANDTLRGADTFRITRTPRRGTATFNASRNIVFRSDSASCGRDTLIYEICNRNGCDTAAVYLNILCDTVPGNLPPVAVDDSATTLINRSIKLFVLKNDTLRGAIVPDVVTFPTHGTVIVMPDSTANYQPNKEFCGLDSFTYRICNTAGCDTALVIIKVDCGDSLIVYNALSPNFDGKNEGLIIRGIENFPNSEVVIFNRWGNEVFRQKAYRNESPWQGIWGDKYLPDGTYFYYILLNDDKGQRFTGFVQIQR